jgi:hypothetical protein
MRKIKLWVAVVFFIFILSLNASAQDVIKKNDYTLTFESNYAELNPALKQRLIETFFQVYPKLAKEYNPNASREVKFFVDTAYKGVAAPVQEELFLVRYGCKSILKILMW